MTSVKIKCDGIMCDSEQTFDLPEWTSRIGIDYGGDSSYLYCGKAECKQQEEFFGAQCPGCVAGYPECGLGRAFAYSSSNGLTNAERAAVRTGVCPFRVNGTFSFSRDTGFQTENLSDVAPSAAGLAVLAAIDAYMAKYGKG